MPSPPQWNHSTYVNNGRTDAVIVKEAIRNDDGTIERRLNVIKNPRRSFWVTNPMYRNHDLKKEYCDISELDEYLVENKELIPELSKALNGYVPHHKPRLKELCNSPYVYGADIPVDTLVKMSYAKRSENEDFIPFTEGFLDIETSVMNNFGEIILLTTTHENKVYTAIHNAYLFEIVPTKEHGDIRRKASIADVDKLCQETLKEYINKYDLQIEYYVGESELDLVKWSFSKIHENKTDFIGIWNINFDIPKIMNAIKKKSIRLEDIMCHPEVPYDLRLCNYYEDKRSKLAHFTEKWHWLHLTGHTQFIDSQNLYSRLRKVKGYESTYNLNAILKKELSLAKLSLGPEGSHYIMQKLRFLDYIAYNIFDAVALYLLERQNTDIESMAILSGVSTYPQFAYQTVMVTNELYVYCKANGKIPAATGSQMKNEYTELIKSTGGTVLKAEKSIGTGICALVERPDQETMLSVFVSDVDFTAYYPSAQCGGNISSETKISTAIAINNKTKPVHDFFSGIGSTKENAVRLCNTYFNLPNYAEIDELMSALETQINVV